MDKNYLRCIWVTVCFLLCHFGEAKDVSRIGDRSNSSANGSGWVISRKTEELSLSSIRDNSRWIGPWNSSRHDNVYESKGRLDINRDSDWKVGETYDKKDSSRNIGVHAGVQYPNKISKYISFKEATYSSTAVSKGISNNPDQNQLKLLINLGVNFFDKLREYYKVPLYINSFFRSAALNKVVGGAIYSDHMADGDVAGIDIDMDGKKGPTNNKMFHYIKGNMPYYKLIAEFPVNGLIRWVHVSYSSDEEKNKERNTYIAKMIGKRKAYLPYKGNEKLISTR